MDSSTFQYNDFVLTFMITIKKQLRAGFLQKSNFGKIWKNFKKTPVIDRKVLVEKLQTADKRYFWATPSEIFPRD